MTNDIFMEIIKRFLEENCFKLLDSKSAEYARGQDKLHNFKRGAQVENCTPEKVLRGFLTKHLVSVYDMIDDLEKNQVLHTKEKWEEKLADSINYLLLLYGLLRDRGFEE